MKCYHSELHTEYFHRVCVYYIYISSQKSSKSGLAWEIMFSLTVTEQVYFFFILPLFTTTAAKQAFSSCRCGEFASCIITAKKLQLKCRPQSLKNKCNECLVLASKSVLRRFPLPRINHSCLEWQVGVSHKEQWGLQATLQQAISMYNVPFRFISYFQSCLNADNRQNSS